MTHAAGDFSSKQVYFAGETELPLGIINHKCDLRVKPPLASDRSLVKNKAKCDFRNFFCLVKAMNS
jgi:hypothetical protein